MDDQYLGDLVCLQRGSYLFVPSPNRKFAVEHVEAVSWDATERFVEILLKRDLPA